MPKLHLHRHHRGFPSSSPSPSVTSSSVASPSVALGSLDESTLKYAHLWDVVIPPPSDTLKGSRFVPSKLRTRGRLRKVSVEVHRMESEADRKKRLEKAAAAASAATADSGTAATLRTLRATIRTAGNTLAGSATEAKEPLEAEKCIVRIMKPPKKKRADHHGREIHFDTEHNDDDDASVISHLDDVAMGLTPLDSGFETPRIPGFDISEADGGGSNEIPDLDEWTTKHELSLKTLDVAAREGKTVKVTIRSKSGKRTRKVIFETEREAEAFCALIDLLKRTQSERDRTALKAAIGSMRIDTKELEERVDLLIEVVSCWDLPVTDLKSSDPYVVVRSGDHVFHRTKHISSSLNPIYTMNTDSLFILSLPVKKLFELDGIIFEVKDYDKFRDNDSIGAAIVPPKTLFQSHGERLEFKLQPLLGEKFYGKGRIAIRCRHATQNDKEVMDALKHDKELYVNNDALTFSGVRSGLTSAIKKTVKRSKSFEGEMKRRVMPGPDPLHYDSTKWMTDQQIEEESMKVSRNWITTGSGKLGKVFLEVIGCCDLPNLDTGTLGDKTDAFVTVVYEDTAVRTDVISDCLSPRWLPWTQRAFVFNMMHCSSQIFLAVADHDRGVGNDHDIVGRVAVDLSTLYPETEYCLQYNLYNSEDMCKRKCRGKIIVRVMIQVENERQFVLSNLQLPPTVHVNVKKGEDFRVVRYACTGKQGKEKYGRKQVNGYVEELLTYKLVFYYARQGLNNVLFWRGHFPVQFKVSSCWKVDLRLPLNSIGVFLAGVCIVERPCLIPSFFFVMIGWILTAVLGFRREHPSPWVRCKPFEEFMRMLALNAAMKPQTIRVGENKEEANAFEQQWEKRIKESEERAKATQAKYQAKLQEHQRDLEEIGDIEIETQVGSGISLDPLRAIWVPLQDTLEHVVHVARFLRAVFLWEECYFAFWLCVCSYILAVLFFVIPWVWILHWVLRIVVWGVLGPWMKLVDIYWEGKIKPTLDRMNESSLNQQRHEMVSFARVERENAKKLKEYKRLLFGKYITKVPVLKYGSKFQNTPLPDSSARPVSESNLNIAEEAAKNCRRVGGQQLVGDMIPVVESEVECPFEGQDQDMKHKEEPSESDPLLPKKDLSQE